MPPTLVEHVAERFRVLGDATRLSILRLLLEQGEMNVGEVCRGLGGASQANVSKHLHILHSAGIVERRPEGTAAYFKVTDPTIAELCETVCDRLKLQAAEEARSFAIA
jgi:DNA-binding transcriptional ArsR family regulator